ncbi:MAG: hypothetical protein V4568_12870 [Pseudomonadota bacterium]
MCHRQLERYTRRPPVPRIHQQQRTDTGRVYNVHTPEVECIAKGKAHKHYELGVKVGIVSTSKDNFILGIKALPGTPYDGHTLRDCLAQVVRTTGKLPQEAFVGGGYRRHGGDRLDCGCQAPGDVGHQEKTQPAQCQRANHRPSEN